MKNLNTKLGIIVIVGALIFGSCSSIQSANSQQKGTGIGAIGGAILGGIIGNQVGDGNSELGALIGGVIGGAAGNMIGRKMDRQAEQIQNEVPGAKVERVNDGEAIAVIFDGESGGVTFPTAKYAVTPNSQATLDKLIQVLKSYPDTNLLVNGHTDNVGSDANNMALSQKRAESVHDYLVKNGLESSRIETKWYGETKPKSTNDTAEGRSINRRVEILIAPNDKMIEEAKKATGQE
ncbi:MAG: OmpA family protein [Flavobacteriales bacterium]